MPLKTTYTGRGIDPVDDLLWDAKHAGVKIWQNRNDGKLHFRKVGGREDGSDVPKELLGRLKKYKGQLQMRLNPEGPQPGDIWGQRGAMVGSLPGLLATVIPGIGEVAGPALGTAGTILGGTIGGALETGGTYAGAARGFKQGVGAELLGRALGWPLGKAAKGIAHVARNRAAIVEATRNSRIGAVVADALKMLPHLPNSGARYTGSVSEAIKNGYGWVQALRDIGTTRALYRWFGDQMNDIEAATATASKQGVEALNKSFAEKHSGMSPAEVLHMAEQTKDAGLQSEVMKHLKQIAQLNHLPASFRNLQQELSRTERGIHEASGALKDSKAAFDAAAQARNLKDRIRTLLNNADKILQAAKVIPMAPDGIPLTPLAKSFDNAYAGYARVRGFQDLADTEGIMEGSAYGNRFNSRVLQKRLLGEGEGGREEAESLQARLGPWMQELEKAVNFDPVARADVLGPIARGAPIPGTAHVGPRGFWSYFRPPQRPWFSSFRGVPEATQLPKLITRGAVAGTAGAGLPSLLSSKAPQPGFAREPVQQALGPFLNVKKEDVQDLLRRFPELIGGTP